MLFKLPPQILVPLIYFVITAKILIKFLLGNVYGVFILSLLLYFQGDTLLTIKPYTFGELMLWYSSLDLAVKTALMASLVTITGFMLAYTTATANWKGELKANLQLQAAGELSSFFYEYATLANACQIYAAGLVAAHDRIITGCTNDEAIFLANYNQEQGKVFMKNRQRMSAMGIDVYSFNSRYGLLLSSLPNLSESLSTATNALQNINKTIWIQVPFNIQHDEHPAQTFLSQVSIDDCNLLKEAVLNNSGGLNLAAGEVTGSLMGTVIDANIWSAIGMYRNWKDFYSAYKER